MSHTPVTAEDLTTYVDSREIEICAHFGEGYHREVRYHVGSRMYRVYDHRQLILSTVSAQVAAEAYNSLRPRVVN